MPRGSFWQVAELLSNERAAEALPLCPTYNPAKKVTYCSWFLSTIVYFLDKVDFTTLDQPPVEPVTRVFIAGQPRAPVDPRPQSTQTPGTS
jgi:hypothetical protein